MPKQTATRGARHDRHFGPQQCQYPGGSCTNERTLKKNGKRHWLCAEHRDQRNAMQRDLYRRTVNKTKKKRAKEKATQEKEKTKMQDTARKKDKVKRVHSSPHIVEKPAASTPAAAPASASDGDAATARVELPTTNEVRPPSARDEVQENLAASAPRDLEDPAQGTGVSVPPGSWPCACCASLATQSPHVVYILMQAVPLQLGAPSQLCMAQQPSLVSAATGGLDAAATQGRQVVMPQLQYAVTPVLQSCVALPPPGSSAVFSSHTIPSISSMHEVPEANASTYGGSGCNAAAPDWPR
ncbi:hypothetical protein PI124_g17247 [Phytophthora idaei]|nr:hypothetical protein PI125_g25306 [Phytophthora idaei]KAG3133238.1 hypothetical protein PI126_g19265 [Phytophthora idaei]KAG3237781.1 hypothetical protein PI124_g17247 [Phytophthora idaei]